MEAVKVVLHRQVWMDGAETEEAVRLLGRDEPVHTVHMPRLVGDAQDDSVVDAGPGHDLAQAADLAIADAFELGDSPGQSALGNRVRPGMTVHVDDHGGISVCPGAAA